MPYTVVFLWISAGATAEPTARHARDLQDFAVARGLSLVRAPESAGSGAETLPARDDALADRIEGELEQARTALSALEETAALERLARVEAELLTHPHLPQAAFLMAESFALRAQAARDSDPALAQQLDARRAALEGPRALAFGESQLARSSAPPSLALTVRGLAPGDLLEMDGHPARSPAGLRAAAGLHHFRVWRAGEPVLAVFVELQSGQQQLELHPRPTRPCSSADLAPARSGAVPAGIACSSWARVRVEGDGIGVSLCQRSDCGAFVHWQRREQQPFAPIGVERGLPTWASFTIVGASAVLLTGLMLWQSGALDRGQSNATTLEYAGYHPQGIRF